MDKTELIKHWEEDLRSRFEENGVLGPNLLPIHIQEEGYELYVATSFSGYRVLNQSFLEFFIRSLRAAEDVAKRTSSGSISNTYGATVLFYANIFNRLRAAEVLFLNGYPLDAFALLRDLKDRAIYLASVISGVSTFLSILGLRSDDLNQPGGEGESRSSTTSRRRKEQRRVMKYMVGAESGLSLETVQDLKRWQGFFDEEVHLSTFTFTFESSGWRGESPRLPVGPHNKKLSAAMYMNRACEIAWMLLRTLPFLQHKPGGFGEQWSADWKLLDQSLRFPVEELVTQGKDIVPSVVELIERKFNFDPTLCYRDTDQDRETR